MLLLQEGRYGIVGIGIGDGGLLGGNLERKFLSSNFFLHRRENAD